MIRSCVVSRRDGEGFQDGPNIDASREEMQTFGMEPGTRTTQWTPAELRGGVCKLYTRFSARIVNYPSSRGGFCTPQPLTQRLHPDMDEKPDVGCRVACDRADLFIAQTLLELQPNAFLLIGR